MAQGIITTARGQVLNLDDLIRKAETPLGRKDAKSSRASAAYKPSTDQKPKIRGFVPGQGEVAVPQGETDEAPTGDKKSQPIAAAYSEDGTAKNLADLTGVKVTGKRQKQTQSADSPEVVDDEDDEVLGNVLKDLKSTDGEDTGKGGKKSTSKKS